ncbi:hypothetical protein PTSG_02536 [Salpingoeca rosetta]|uniref:Uncharacterized protein n=1 Tax=Salpingoeca rosetta (strain ATCC 50818 / BSB-021) TaxID=946362 RepID=F2U2H0_SALR5|nr:uncharacterized protein PTSG_02536 [Salpingoeca rosetta]EGD81822.1 hypothetical protein PTSG_02536 [Salpingoeca rosetta]|eukprot:XP_004997026.1 hypothetical protein PTSG_02536 [Salpingoeca rosetta]
MASTLSYIIREREEEPGHRFGVNALAVSSDESVLFSAGRDGVVREWTIGPSGDGKEKAGVPKPTYRRCYDQHANWVNDVALCEDLGYVLTASSDHNVKIWDNRRCSLVATLQKHNDFVRAISYSKHAHKFVTGGLDRRLVYWDIERTKVSSDIDMRSHPQSIYACAINPGGTVIATGSTDKMIRLFDPRTKTRVGMLSGHGDMVKALALSPDGRTIVSGSSDQLVKVWDVSSLKCIATVAPHTDSVWALAVDKAFSRVYSGGRDGLVYETNLAAASAGDDDATRLICQTQHRVLGLAVTDASVWVSTTASDITSFSRTETNQETPQSVIPGLPGLVEHHVMRNRRHVLTKDTAGAVAKWDMLTATKIEDCAGADYETEVKRDVDIMRLPSWCTVDTNVGLVTVTLSPGTAFKCRDLVNPNDASDDTSMNFGECVIQALLRTYQEVALASKHRLSHPNDPQSAQELEAHYRDVNFERQLTHNYFSIPHHTPFYFTQHVGGAAVSAVFKPARIRVAMGKVEEAVPDWIRKCLFTPHDALTPPTSSSSITFVMIACHGTPSLAKNRLTCFSYLPVWRVSHYIFEVSTKVNTLVKEHAGKTPQGPEIYDYVEILHGSEVLHRDTHLAYVNFRFGKRDKELELKFRLAHKHRPAISVEDDA